jgi:hypothetical protein
MMRRFDANSHEEKRFTANDFTFDHVTVRAASMVNTSAMHSK